MSEVLTVATRLLWVANNAPYNMDSKIDFIQGWQHGFLNFTIPSEGRRVRIHWTPSTLRAWLDRFTWYVTFEAYGPASLEEREPSAAEKVVVCLSWTDKLPSLWLGFSSKTKYKQWLKLHEEWADLVDVGGV